MNLQSVISMLKQARSNATLYNKMLAAGYTDEEFPDWWYSPARVAKAAKGPGKDAEGAEVRKDTEKVVGYEPTPPRIPTPREDESGRPVLKPASVPSVASEVSTVQPATVAFSDAELSLLKDRGITELTPGRWMHTAEQADGRIVSTRA